MENRSTKYTPVLFVVGVLFIIWGILGIMDFKNYTYLGYSAAPDFSVFEIDEDSPAETAGMMIGDIIKENGGIAVTDSKALSERKRAKIGETREFIVDRNGEDISLQLTFAGLTKKYKAIYISLTILGLLFVLSGVYTIYVAKNNLSLIYAIFALAVGFNFLYGPYIDSEFISRLITTFAVTIIYLSFAVLANFTLKYPPESNFVKKKNNLIKLYTPVILIILYIWIQIFVQPDSTSTMRMINSILVGIMVVGYFLVSLVTLIKKYSKTNSAERNKQGLNLLLFGAIIGLAPVLIYQLLYTISPKIILPGDDYVILTFVAIPVCFTMAVTKQSKQVLE